MIQPPFETPFNLQTPQTQLVLGNVIKRFYLFKNKTWPGAHFAFGVFVVSLSP